VQKPIYSSEEEQLLMSRLWSSRLRDDPESFVLFAFPWSQKGTPLENFKGPRKWQRDVLRDIRDHIRSNRNADTMEALRQAIASGRGIGKSALVSWLILWMLTTRIGSTIIVSANSENQLRTVTWGELTKWHAMIINSHWWEPTATKLAPAQWLIDLVNRDLRKGTRYWVAEGKLWSEENPDSYAGAHNHDGMMVIFDEASGIADPIWSVANGFFTENILDRYWFAFSNPRRNKGYFYDCFNVKRNFWIGKQIDARTVEDTDKSIYDQIIEEYGPDSYEARVEVYGEFPSIGDEQFIGEALINDAMSRPLYKDYTAPIVIGVDPARGGDNTVILVRQGRDIVSIRRYRTEDTMEIVGNVIDAVREYNPALTIIDQGGLGGPILDRLKEQRYKVRGVDFGWASKKPSVYKNKRAEMWGEMKDWLRTASIPNDRQLKSDLMAPCRKDSEGAIALLLESKKDMRGRRLASPDSADALAVTFAYPVANREGSVVDRNHSRVYSGSNVYSNSWMGN